MAYHDRPPIVAVVGHIDHGKSTLQQALREIEMRLEEAGDITQHIGAYSLRTTYEGSERTATVIDTPGHEVFSHIREHGIDLADLALLVVSAEDGWQDQTSEVYQTIQKLRTPFIVVFTKIDSERADLERAKHSVLQNEVLLEGLGGSVPWIGVSAATGEKIDELIELIFLTSDVYEITENKDDESIGVLVEADIDPRMGIAGTVIVLRGILEEGKHVRVRQAVAPLRIMKNDRGVRIASAEPSVPVRIIGFDSVPEIGQQVFLHDSKKEALKATRTELDKSKQKEDAHDNSTNAKKTIPLILRSDTASGLDSVHRSILNASVDGISFKLVKKDVGAITEEDIRMANLEKGGVVIGFHTHIDQRAKHLAERLDVTAQVFSTIYEAIEWVASISSTKKEEYEMDNITGKAEVVRIFEENRNRHIIGVKIREGEFFTGQEIIIKRNKAIASRFHIKTIEQRNKQQNGVSGEKTEFATQIEGSGAVALGDTVLGMPTLH